MYYPENCKIALQKAYQINTGSNKHNRSGAAYLPQIWDQYWVGIIHSYGTPYTCHINAIEPIGVWYTVST